jgi:hypothetical protein
VLSRALELSLAAMLLLAACDDPLLCYEGDYRSCGCADGARGYQPCLGTTFGACVCDGTTPGLLTTTTSSGAGGAAGSGGAPLLPFMSECEDSAECETKSCYFYAAKGSFCTQPCTSPADCPPPSSGCNNKGVCKPP